MFLYYVPGAANATAETIESAGLSHALDPGSIIGVQVTRGPDDKNGIVIASADAPANIVGHYPGSQTWRQAPGGVYWVGIDERKRPTPESLMRPDALNGHAVELADGNQWIIPVARSFAQDDGELRYYCSLPHGVDLDDDGNWTVGSIRPRYAELWALAEKWWDAKQSATVDDNSVSLDFGEIHDSALAALKCNYRVGKVEVVLLGLFAGSSAVAILDALIDMPSLDEILKKKADT